MKNILTIISFLFIAGCASQPPIDPVNPESAMLLVAMSDGRFVMQEIAFDADICWKVNDSPKTGCFKKGDPVIDPDTDRIVGYEMIKSDLSLHPKQ